jgi:hypothetical protein
MTTLHFEVAMTIGLQVTRTYEVRDAGGDEDCAFWDSCVTEYQRRPQGVPFSLSGAGATPTIVGTSSQIEMVIRYRGRNEA